MTDPTPDLLPLDATRTTGSSDFARLKRRGVGTLRKRAGPWGQYIRYSPFECTNDGCDWDSLTGAPPLQYGGVPDRMRRRDLLKAALAGMGAAAFAALPREVGVGPTIETGSLGTLEVPRSFWPGPGTLTLTSANGQTFTFDAYDIVVSTGPHLWDEVGVG